MKAAGTTLRRYFSTKAPEFNNYYMLRMQFGPDGYY